ncbi:MAG: PQQ-dependent sugar dehydrogenase [Armatimonadota bacterium]|nr:PQQ-dependent sugar dehydrogenase [Armatimonadota bacterium]
MRPLIRFPPAAAVCALLLVAHASSDVGAPPAALPQLSVLTPSRPPAPARRPGPVRQAVLRPVVSGLSQPVYVTHAGDGSGRLFIVEQAGLVRIFRNGALLPTPYLDIRSRVTCCGEMGLLSVAFHPRYAVNGRFFVNYTTETGGRRSVIAEYRVSPTNPDVADPAERVLLEIPQPFRNHNGGLNLFGPDGTLYIGLGDGGGAGDPQGNGQRLDVLLGKVLRIDVDRGTPYGIPRDNPFIRIAGVRREIYAYGLRNPWRFSFDRVTHRLFLADVGQNTWEEINIIEQGNNYGWNIMEGAHCYPPGTPCSVGDLVLPIAEYDHTQGCSVTGGYVYRGSAVPELAGKYIFGDYCSGRIWTLTETSPGRWVMALLLHSGLNISSFGEDQDGELNVVHHGGAVYVFAP